MAGIMLEQIAYPNNFAFCFLAAVVFFIVSWLALNRTREVPRQLDVTGFISLPFWQSVTTILKKDPGFRWYILVRNVGQFGSMAFAFYTVFAVKQQGMSDLMVSVMTGILLITQTIANPLFGWLADHWNKRYVLEFGSVAAALSAILAWGAKDTFVFALVFILAGIANTIFWTIGMAFTLSYGTEQERPTYVGLANTLIAPSAVIAPLIGGTVADSAGYPVTFIASAAASVVTLVILHFFVQDPGAKSPVVSG